MQLSTSNLRHPHHTQIVVVMSVAIALALVAIAVVIGGYLTNWFGNASGASAGVDASGAPVSAPVSGNVDPATYDYPTSFNLVVTYTNGSAQTGPFSKVNAASPTITVGGTAILAESILAVWKRDDSENYIILALNDGYADDGTYYWVLANSIGVGTSYDTGNSLDVFDMNGDWSSVTSAGFTVDFVFTAIE